MNDRKLQLLVASVNRDPEALLRSLNLHCDAIVINQSDKMSFYTYSTNGREVEWFDFPDRGVGRSRNEALLRAEASYVLFCDEDCSYFPNTQDIILQGFKDNPDADILLFDMEPYGCSQERPTLRITRREAVGRLSYMKYGAVNIAARLASLQKNSICFNLLFGGGATYACGEDSIFLKDCIDKGLSIKTCPETIGRVDFSTSSWFSGFNKQYFYSRGALHRRVAGKCHWLLSLRLLFKLRKVIKITEGINGLNGLRALLDGAAEYSRL